MIFFLLGFLAGGLSAVFGFACILGLGFLRMMVEKEKETPC